MATNASINQLKKRQVSSLVYSAGGRMITKSRLGLAWHLGKHAYMFVLDYMFY